MIKITVHISTSAVITKKNIVQLSIDTAETKEIYGREY